MINEALFEIEEKFRFEKFFKSKNTLKVYGRLQSNSKYFKIVEKGADHKKRHRDGRKKERKCGRGGWLSFFAVIRRGLIELNG